MTRTIGTEAAPRGSRRPSNGSPHSKPSAYVRRLMVLDPVGSTALADSLASFLALKTTKITLKGGAE
jgi:hypothetical protein